MYFHTVLHVMACIRSALYTRQESRCKTSLGQGCGSVVARLPVYNVVPCMFLLYYDIFEFRVSLCIFKEFEFDLENLYAMCRI